MNTFAKNILIAGILSIAASTAIVAQTGNSQFDQWYRAKYGRSAPTESATPATASPLPETAQLTAAAAATSGFEQWYLAKYGRPAPAEEARLQAAPQANTAVVAAALPVPAIVSDDLTVRTPADHLLLAQRYREQAQSYLAQAREHTAMIAAYQANPSLAAKNRAAAINHCEYYAAKFNQLAAQSQQFAQLHEQMARNAELN